VTKKEYNDYRTRVERFFAKEGVENLSTGLLKCPDCEAEFDGGACPECGKDAGEFPTEPHFSRRPCECCERPEGGDRYDANGYNPMAEAVQEYQVCPDCVYFAEYGRLDDTTMAEVEADTDTRFSFAELEPDMPVVWRGQVATVVEVDKDFVRLLVPDDPNPYRLYAHQVDGGDPLTVPDPNLPLTAKKSEK
jgi:hypothetical protein